MSSAHLPTAGVARGARGRANERNRSNRKTSNCCNDRKIVPEQFPEALPRCECWRENACLNPSLFLEPCNTAQSVAFLRPTRQSLLKGPALAKIVWEWEDEALLRALGNDTASKYCVKCGRRLSSIPFIAVAVNWKKAVECGESRVRRGLSVSVARNVQHCEGLRVRALQFHRLLYEEQ